MSVPWDENHIATIVLFMVTFIGVTLMSAMDYADGAISSNDFGTKEASCEKETSQNQFAIAPNGTWMYFYSDGSSPWYLNISYSNDSGSSWEDETVIPQGWGHTDCHPLGIHATANNSTILFFQANGKGGSAYEYYFVKETG